MGIVGIDIYLWVMIKESNGLTIGFLILGLLLLVLSLLAFWMRRSIHLLGMYLVVVLGFLLFELIITIVLTIKKESIIVIAEKYIGNKTA